MKKTDNIFDCLENAEGREMERITNKTPQLDDKQLERILEMSERKYNIKKRNDIEQEYNEGYQTQAEGVEEYKRPAWLRFAAPAAALVLTGGIVAASLSLLKNRNEIPNIHTIPNTAATSVVTGTVTTDEANGLFSSVTEESTAIKPYTETTAISTEDVSTVQSSQTSQQAAENTASSQQDPQQVTTSPNALSEDQCYDVIDEKNEDMIIYEEIVQVPCKEYMDYSDTFFATGIVTHDTFSDGHPLLEKPNEFTVKFVHYTDPRFNTINDIRNFVKDYYNCWNGGNGSDLDKMFGQSIEPASVIENDIYIPEYFYVYTEYNGKIYRGIDPQLNYDKLESHESFYTGELMKLRWGHDYLRNITDSSFETYRVNEDGNGGYYGQFRYFYNDGGKWKTDISKEREISDSECRSFIGS